jgi:uncharacterized membrane protein YdjX (TVP38/TMEM64 family)
MGPARTAGRTSSGPAAAARHPLHPRDDKLVFSLITVPIVVTTVMATVGAAIAPELFVDAPLALIALNARTEYLLLVAPRVSFGVFVMLGSVRWLGSSICFFLLGHRYGESVVRWAERRVGGRLVRWSERLVHRAGWIVVPVWPNAAVSVAAGGGGMAVGPYLVLATVGTVGRMIAIHLLGRAFTDPIRDVTDFIVRYRWPLTAVSLVAVTVAVLRHRRRGDSRLETPEEIEADLESETD